MSGTHFSVWVVFYEFIMQTGALLFGTISCIIERYPRNVPTRLDGFNWPRLSSV